MTQHSVQEFQLWTDGFSNLPRWLKKLLGSGRSVSFQNSDVTKMSSHLWKLISSCVSTWDSIFPGREVRLWISFLSSVSEINTHLKIVPLLYAGTLFSTCGLQASLQGRSLVENLQGRHKKWLKKRKFVPMFYNSLNKGNCKKRTSDGNFLGACISRRLKDTLLILQISALW